MGKSVKRAAKCWLCSHPKARRILRRVVPSILLAIALVCAGVYFRERTLAKGALIAQACEFLFNMVGEHFIWEEVV